MSVSGHDTGDEFLCAIARRLQQHMGNDGLLGRIGGDEFIIAAVGPEEDSAALSAAEALHKRVSSLLSGRYQLSSCMIDYAGPSIGALAVDPASIRRRVHYVRLTH